MVDVLSWACLVAAASSASSARIGMLRMPDFYTRMHAASVIDTLGAGLILFGLMLQAGFTLVAAKLLMIGAADLLRQPDRRRTRWRGRLGARPEAAAGRPEEPSSKP